MPKVAPDVVAPPPAGSLDLSPNRSYKHDLWPKNKGLDSTPEDFKWASPSGGHSGWLMRKREGNLNWVGTP